jgi:hypothetical protein
VKISFIVFLSSLLKKRCFYYDPGFTAFWKKDFQTGRRMDTTGILHGERLWADHFTTSLSKRVKEKSRNNGQVSLFTFSMSHLFIKSGNISFENSWDVFLCIP